MLTLRTMTAWSTPRHTAARHAEYGPESRRATQRDSGLASPTAEMPPIRLWPLGDATGGAFDASLAALAACLHCGRDNGD